MGFSASSTDPFIDFMRPPPGETPAQMTARQKREVDAQRISDMIDEQIKHEKAQAKKEKNVIKVLLLGQSESGKSTTLKNFRMLYAKAIWDQERNGWRSVIQLNVVRSITTILNVVEAEMNGEEFYESDSDDDRLEQGHGSDSDDDQNEVPKFTDRHRLLMIRLAPLRSVEQELKRKLGSGTEPIPRSLPMAATPFDNPLEYVRPRRKITEPAVRSWKDVLQKPYMPISDNGESVDLDSATLTMASCKDDMKTLWEDKSVRMALKKRKLRLPDSAGFFLNDLDRIATRSYAVNDNDIVRARLRTVGIQEHKICFKQGPWDGGRGRETGWEWRIFDVGGCRTSRHAWLPFFDAVNVIIFLSPVSVFDQRLEEDSRVNRLQDSFVLWTSICSSKLLSNTQLILFLNKCDLLRRKLKRGVKVMHYLPSYGTRPNEVLSVVKYLREKFRDIQKTNSPKHRASYIYPTTVTDTEATAVTLESVQDGVLRENLSSSQLI